MSVQFLQKKSAGTETSPTSIADDTTGRSIIRNLSRAAGIAFDRGANLLKYNGNDAIKTIVSTDDTQTLTNKTLTAPTLTSPVTTTPSITSPTITGNATTGVVVSKTVLFSEQAGTTLTGTVPIPAGATVHSIKFGTRVLAGGTSAVLKIGDGADDDGYFAGVDLKATDLLVGEVLESNNDGLWGGKNGAYLVAATGQRGPTTSNFGMYYEAGGNIIAVVTQGTPSTTGRYWMTVEYSVGELITAVVA